jgi:hypothetical protein
MSHMLRPFTKEEILQNLDEDKYISGNVAVELSSIVRHNRESFLDLLSTKLVGNDQLMDISYEATGVSGTGEVVIKVTGDPSQALELSDD